MAGLRNFFSFLPFGHGESVDLCPQARTSSCALSRGLGPHRCLHRLLPRVVRKVECSTGYLLHQKEAVSFLLECTLRRRLASQPPGRPIRAVAFKPESLFKTPRMTARGRKPAKTKTKVGGREVGESLSSSSRFCPGAGS